MDKIEHLKLIQNVIARMASNSFMTKGWCVTLVSAIIVLAAKDPNKRVVMIAFFPVIMFWLLDSYFLYQERLFRKLYDFIRLKDVGTETDFTMCTSLINNDENQKITWIETTFSKTLILFYITMLISVIFIVLFAF